MEHSQIPDTTSSTAFKTNLQCFKRNILPIPPVATKGAKKASAGPRRYILNMHLFMEEANICMSSEAAWSKALKRMIPKNNLQNNRLN